jgi:hypothetical protein
MRIVTKWLSAIVGYGTIPSRDTTRQAQSDRIGTDADGTDVTPCKVFHPSILAVRCGFGRVGSRV